MEKVYGIMRYQNTVQVEEITECLKLNWDYKCIVGDDIPDGRGNGRFILTFDNNQLGRFKFDAEIRYNWNNSEALVRINGGIWISALVKSRNYRNMHRTFLKAIMEKVICLCNFPPYTKAVNEEENLNFPSLVVKRVLDDANIFLAEGNTYTYAEFIRFPSEGIGSCEISSSSDLLNDLENGGAVCFHYKVPYTTNDNRIVDNFHSKYYLIEKDKSINDVFKFNCGNRTITIGEKWAGWDRGYCYDSYVVVRDEKGYVAESQKFESALNMFNFIMLLANLIDDDTTNEEIKQYVSNYDPKTGFTRFVKKLVKRYLSEK